MGFKELAEIGAAQHGVVSLAQAHEHFERHELTRVVAAGRLERVAPKAFRLAGTPLSWEGRVLAEQLSAGQHALVSHRTAAALHGLDGFDAPRVTHLTVPAGRHPGPRRDVKIHRARDHDLADPVKRQGIWVTSAGRTLLDLCVTEPNPAVRQRAVYSARKLKLCTWTELWACLAVHAQKGRPGLAEFRALLDKLDGQVSESALEDLIVEAVRQAGRYPPHVLQHWVGAGGRRYRIDVAWPEWLIGIEGHSRAEHDHDEAFEADPVRAADLAIAGWILVPATAKRLRHDPGGFFGQLDAAFRTRGACAGPGAPGPWVSAGLPAPG